MIFIILFYLFTFLLLSFVAEFLTPTFYFLFVVLFSVVLLFIELICMTYFNHYIFKELEFKIIT